MFNLGPLEFVAIFVVALLVFGPDKLPEMGRQVGRAVREFKKFQASMQTQVRDVMEPITGPMTSSNGPLVNPQPTNIKGTLPTEAPPNVPRSATIQDPSASEGEEASPPGTFGHYAPVEPPTSGGAAPADESAAASQPEGTPPAGPSDPDAG